ncbi:MAG: hypothetical protein HUU21_03445 [Polyangiaceae bacterium]|nr:hypothetical protein [Polyangiaceae bacterium]
MSDGSLIFKLTMSRSGSFPMAHRDIPGGLRGATARFSGERSKGGKSMDAPRAGALTWKQTKRLFANLNEAGRAVVGIAGIVLRHVAQEGSGGLDRPDKQQVTGEDEGRS